MRIGYVTPIFFAALATSSGEAPSSCERPRTARPWPLYFEDNSWNQGISSLQGPHHMAQQFTTTGWPLKSASETFLPEMSLSVNAGASLPRRFEPSASGGPELSE